MSKDTLNPRIFKYAIKQFQKAWGIWMQTCYAGTNLPNDPEEAKRRFAEEAIELLQSLNMPPDELIKMVNWVYTRKKGKPYQEAAGALSTLATLCNAHDIDLGYAAVDDLNYCWSNILSIRTKNALKPKFGDK